MVCFLSWFLSALPCTQPVTRNRPLCVPAISSPTGIEFSSILIHCALRVGIIHHPLNPFAFSPLDRSVHSSACPARSWSWSVLGLSFFFFDVQVGKGKCHIVDTFWQTETGGHVMLPLANVTPTKPGSCSFPFFGIEVIRGYLRSCLNVLSGQMDKAVVITHTRTLACPGAVLSSHVNVFIFYV